MDGLVVASVGMPGSGKSLISAAAAEGGIPVHSMGDLIRAEVAAAGLEETPDNVGMVARMMREAHGPQVWSARLLAVVDEALGSHPWVLIEGMRSLDERAQFNSHWGGRFRVVALVAPTEVRWTRIAGRGRGEDGDRADFDRRDARESAWGLPRLIDEADWRLENATDDLQDLQTRLSDWRELVTRLAVGN